MCRKNYSVCRPRQVRQAIEPHQPLPTLGDQRDLAALSSLLLMSVLPMQ
ncbi:hypothetical protein [Pseudomonas sp. PAMC 26793]|nr:hypothetical protein [Pseudomonas sp. PAMC 26793]